MKKVAFALTPMLLFFACAELLAGLAYEPEAIRYEGIFEYDADRVYRLKPSFRGEMKEQAIATNSFGHRDTEIPIAKAPDTLRVVLIGDSVTFGPRVNPEHTFGEVLEDQLNSARAPQRVDVINAGVPGYSAFQEYYQLEAALELEPDLIVLQAIPNDVTEPYRIARRFGGSGKDYHDVEDMPYYHFVLSQRSAFYLFLRDMWARVLFADASGEHIQEKAIRREKYWVADLVHKSQHPEIRERWKAYLHWLENTVTLARDNGVPLILMVTPYRLQFPLPPRLAHPQKILRDFAAERGLVFVDLLAELHAEFARSRGEGQDGAALGRFIVGERERDRAGMARFWNDYFLDHAHLNAAGHRYVSALLYPLVADSLDGAPTPSEASTASQSGFRTD